MSWWSKWIGGGLSEPIEAIGNVLDKVATTGCPLNGVKINELITSTEPKYLAQFVRECMPDYALVKKESVLKAKELLAGLG